MTIKCSICGHTQNRHIIEKSIVRCLDCGLKSIAFHPYSPKRSTAHKLNEFLNCVCCQNIKHCKINKRHGGTAKLCQEFKLQNQYSIKSGAEGK
jgi:DNA-directed RNA polymerase subunit RPC12/RpoP